MMTNMKTLYARTGAAAIAAVLALSSTQLSAQEAIEPAPATVTTPAPAPDTIATDPLAPVTTNTSTPQTPKPKATAKHVASAKKTTAVPARTVTHAPAKQPAAPTDTMATAVPVAPTVPASAVGAPTAVTPEPATTPISPVAQTNADKLDTMMEVGGGALALLVLGGGAALAVRRRRRREEEEEELAWADETIEPEPIAAEPRHDPIFNQQPAVYAPSASAFGWGDTQPATTTSDDGSDRRPGETWVDRAYRGPSPANPSVSIRARLKRAVFFDKREREVAAGTAVSVESDAGLPDNLDQSTGTQEREHEVA
jgi:hypothetical protein